MLRLILALGGLKLWECAVDLCNYIEENAGTLNLSGKRVLEVGVSLGKNIAVRFLDLY